MRRTQQALALVLSVALTISLAVAYGGVAAQQEDGTRPEEVSVDDIRNVPEEFFDRRVEVQGQVGNIVTSDAFTIEGEGGREILVAANPDLIPDGFEDDAALTIVGVVREFAQDQPLVTEAGEDLGIAPSQRAFQRFAGQPILVAESIDTDLEFDGEFREEFGILSVGEVAGDPESFRNRRVTVLAEIEEFIAAGAWAIGSDDVETDLLVVTPEANVPSAVTEDALVQVTGTVVYFDPEREYEIGDEVLDLTEDDAEALDDWSDELAIVAESFELVAPALGEMIANIVDDPEAYYGEQVSLLGTVDSVEDERVFAFDGPEGFLGLSEETLLAFGAVEVMPAGVVEDAIVQVRGTVRQFDPAEEVFTEEVGLDTEDEFFEDVEGEPVVVVASAQVLAAERGETVENILDDAEGFLGDEVTVAGGVEEELLAQAFTIEGSDGFFGLTEDNLLVIGSGSAFEQAGVTEEAIVVVEGTVRRFDLADTYEFDGEPIAFDDEELLADWEGDAVLVASSVNVIAID